MSGRHVDIVLPALGESIAAAKVSAWLRREGESIAAGQPIVEVETDKTTVEIEAPASGVLLAIRVSAGTEGVGIGTVLGTVAEGAREEFGIDPAHASRTSTRPDGQSVEPSAALPNLAGLAEPTRPADLPHSTTPHVAATPLAARMAVLAGLDLTALSAARRGARLTKSDVEAWLGGSVRAQAGLPSHAHYPPPVAERFEHVPLTAIRRVTAERLQRAKQEIPHFYLQVDCHVTNLTRLRARLNESQAPERYTVTDFLVIACAEALKEVPLANAIWADNRLHLSHTIDIAVAVNTPKGLLTPVVRGCESKSLAAITHEVRRLAERARAGTLAPHEYSGGTFTVSNLGMFGVGGATPIINPPQCCILGVGAIERRPVAIGDGLAVGDMMSCTLAADHRAIDGATGAQLLQAIRRRLESPESMVTGASLPPGRGLHEQ